MSLYFMLFYLKVFAKSFKTLAASRILLKNKTKKKRKKKEYSQQGRKKNVSTNPYILLYLMSFYLKYFRNF